ncbi:MAG: hypothetical protein IKN47_07760 [Lachnospiraceae bacterium]|nr:hypothetical protein [Lachnospiraceae bacterium]
MKPGIISKSPNGWRLSVIANGSLSVNNDSLESDDIDRIEELLRPDFEPRMKEAHVFVSYDNWSGVFIMYLPGFKSKEADELIKEIYAFLKD